MMFCSDDKDAKHGDPSATYRKLILVASIGTGVQFGWALQLSLLTPYTQLLGLSHQWVSFVWLCGPISGLVVQPMVGHYSDRCTMSLGRRRPFIVSGGLLLCLGVFLIGFAADIGRSALGDPLERGVFRRGAAGVFVVGFWILDISNNMIQGPCRALLADLSRDDDDAMVTAGNALFATFMALGNILGYFAASIEDLHLVFPFAKTNACDQNCANIKTCFLISVIITLFIISLLLVFIKEKRLDPMFLNYLDDNFYTQDKAQAPSFLMQIFMAAKSTSKPIRILYIVTALNWFGFFPFTLYDTDWMGKEVYGGAAQGNMEQLHLYSEGVRAGSVGLAVYVVTMGFASLFLETLVRLLGNVRRLWSLANFLLAMCMGFTVLISAMAQNYRNEALVTKGTPFVHPSNQLKLSFFALFAVLGIPQAVTYTIPFTLASIYSKDSGIGQGTYAQKNAFSPFLSCSDSSFFLVGLALGLLNLAIVIPQMIVALISGPLDSFFKGSNLPAFVFGGIAATIGGFAAMNLPYPE